jgi:plasmid maintenance system antidote protein VapI
MTNTKLLEAKINESGKKIKHLCAALGISYPTLRRLLTGQSEFTTGQIKTLCEQLGITDQAEKESIFFA